MPSKLAFASLAASIALASPVLASGGIFCEGEGASIDIAMGRLVVMQVIGASAEIGGTAYATGSERGSGAPFVIGQAFAEGDAIMADFVDPNVERILVSLRVTWDGAESWTGTLSTPDLSVPVTCWEG